MLLFLKSGWPGDSNPAPAFLILGCCKKADLRGGTPNQSIISEQGKVGTATFHPNKGVEWYHICSDSLPLWKVVPKEHPVPFDAIWTDSLRGLLFILPESYLILWFCHSTFDHDISGYWSFSQCRCVFLKLIVRRYNTIIWIVGNLKGAVSLEPSYNSWKEINFCSTLEFFLIFNKRLKLATSGTRSIAFVEWKKILLWTDYALSYRRP